MSAMPGPASRATIVMPGRPSFSTTVITMAPLHGIFDDIARELRDGGGDDGEVGAGKPEALAQRAAELARGDDVGGAGDGNHGLTLDHQRRRAPGMPLRGPGAAGRHRSLQAFRRDVGHVGCPRPHCARREARLPYEWSFSQMTARRLEGPASRFSAFQIQVNVRVPGGQGPESTGLALPAVPLPQLHETWIDQGALIVTRMRSRLPILFSVCLAALPATDAAEATPAASTRS